MRTRRWVALACGSALLVAAGAIGASAGSKVAGPKTIHVIEHPNTDKVVDTGKPGDSSGDLLTFHNPVFNESDTAQVGHDQGQCIREAPKHGTWECTWTTFLSGGQIAVEGPFYDTKNNSVLAVTGGTGNFANVRGEMNLKFRNGGTEFDFVFHLTD